MMAKTLTWAAWIQVILTLPIMELAYQFGGKQEIVLVGMAWVASALVLFGAQCVVHTRNNP